MSPMRHLQAIDFKTKSSYVLNNVNYTEKFTAFKKYSAKKLESDETLYFDDLFNETLYVSYIVRLT
jgi:hypothetical protein